jgi:hypothetical protein
VRIYFRMFSYERAGSGALCDGDPPRVSAVPLT